MKKLKEPERKKILDYIMKEPEINLFFIGDMENYGLESEEVSVYVQETRGEWDCLILRYFDNYIIYSQNNTFYVPPVIDFLKDRIIDSMNGKADIIRQIAPYFPKMKMDLEYMCKCSRIRPIETFSEIEVKRLTGADAEQVVDLYLSVEEIAPRYTGRREKKIAEKKFNLERNSFGMGVFVRDRLVCAAETSADNSISAMIIGVATHQDFRGRGYASKTVSLLCEESFRRGKEFLCLFYDNPNAGRIYRKIGFEEIGKYALMY